MTDSVLLPERNDFSDISEDPRAFNLLSKLFGTDMAAQQLQLEHEAYALGEERFRKNLERSMEQGEYADSAPAQPLLSTIIPKFVIAYRQWIEGQAKVSRRSVILETLKELDAEVAAVITLKKALGMIASGKETTVAGMGVAIGLSIEEQMRYGRIREQEAAHYKKFIAKALDKRNGINYKRQYMSAVEREMLKAEQLQTAWVPWESSRVGVEDDNSYHFKVGIQMMQFLILSSELIRWETIGHVKESRSVVTLHPLWAEKLAKRALNLAAVAPMYQPCVVPPKEWRGTKGGGYWANGRKPMSFIRVRNRKALERYRHVDMPEVYRAVNLAQATAWSVNGNVLRVANELAGWQSVGIQDFPGLEEKVLPEPIEGMDNCPVLLKAWKKQAAAVHRRHDANVSRRLRFEFILEQANKFSEYQSIWFPYNLDWRGRVYALPMFNPQGNDMTKGLLQAAEGRPIGTEGRKWLAIHGANTAGVDKVSLKDRVKWVEDNTPMILACARDPLGCQEWMSMDSPFCFLAFCFEWLGVSREGVAWVSALPVAFDGSCSGIQHFSAMLRDEKGGRAVNLLPSEKVQDIYQLVADEVNKRLAEDFARGTANDTKLLTNKKTGELTEIVTLGTKTMAAGWIAYGVTRKVTKRSVMTLPYGSKEYGFADQLLKDIISPAIDSGMGSQFTDKGQFSRYLAKLIWEAVSIVVVAAVEAMNWLQSAAKLMAAEVVNKKTKEVLKPRMAITWTTPDGFPVWQEYFKPEDKRIQTMFLGTVRMETTINVRDTDEIDARKQEAGVSPNFVHSQDGSHLRMTVVRAHEVYGVEFFALIHDSFGTIPAHAGAMFRAVRETMVETYSNNDVLADFREQFMDQLHESQFENLPMLPSKGTLDLSQILESDFAFA